MVASNNDCPNIMLATDRKHNDKLLEDCFSKDLYQYKDLDHIVRDGRDIYIVSYQNISSFRKWFVDKHNWQVRGLIVWWQIGCHDMKAYTALFGDKRLPVNGKWPKPFPALETVLIRSFANGNR